MVALHWIKNNGERSIFASNRIKEIARISSPENWRHVPGRMNPADVLSRGRSPRHLLESKWFGGPEWLLEDAVTWPTNELQLYRTVHLELVTALPTNNFLLSLRRFKARRGRPSVVYTDNGTNFRGAVREFKNLDWIKIERETEIQRIKWKFNPPTAAWWGGWWKRLIRVLKDLLKRTLGNAVLTYEELLTVLCDCESIVNSRPLTYVSEDSDDLIPLTPAMFMMSNASLDVTDLGLSDFARFQKRVKFRARLLKDLRGRFRKEYLGLLVQKGHKTTRTLKVGEIALIENPNKKRFYWPLGKVIELIPGRNGKVRTLKQRCSNSEIIRPIQRVFPLEIQSAEMGESNDVPLDVEALKITSAGVDVSESAIPVNAPPNIPKVSRYGRTIERPRRLNVFNVTTVFESE
ncbi:integrase catalytic domain-containing protein [Trichonephila clavipes]|nr:integrase catalytic domain-containing protein [Trichonephila clavipes]